MHKKILVLLTGAIALSISAVPVLASDPPTDDGQYIWQDENGDYWYRNGSEDEYIGEGNYAPDPDSGELMEGNDAGWTEQDGYFEPHYYYEDGSVWLEDATGTTYIGSRDKYYIDDYGNLQEYSDSETDSSSGDSSEESSDTSGNSSSQDSDSSYPNSSSDTNTEDSSESEKRGELHMRVGFPADDTIRESMPEKEGYFEQRSVNGGKSTAFVLKVPNSSLEDSSLKGFLAEYYPVKGEIITKKDLTFESYPATKYQYLTEVNEEEKNVDALVCQTDDYTFGLFVLTPSDTYDKAAEKEATELIKSIDFVYAERVDMAMTDYFQVLTPERWKYLCHYETTETENGGYKLTYYNEDVKKTYNYKKLSLTASLTNKPKPNITVDEIYAFDSEDISKANNGDGIIQPGETIDLAIGLRNQWGAAKNVTITVNATTNGIDNQYVEFVSDKEVGIDDIGSFGTQNNGFKYNESKTVVGVEHPIRVKIKDNAPNDLNIQFNINYKAKNGLDENDTTVYRQSYDTTYTIHIVKGIILSGEIKNDVT